MSKKEELMNDIHKTIGWADKSWNCIVGCNNGCSFCYARKIAMRFTGHFKPTFHKNRLNEPLKEKKPLRIFADSMSDFWSLGVKQEWRSKIWDVMKRTPQHTYFVLTKRPERITRIDLKQIPLNCWIGVSVTKYEDTWRLPKLLSKLRSKKHSFVSIEPCLDNVFSSYIYLTDWIIIGGLTGVKNPFRPDKKTIDELVSSCKKWKKPLFIKDNLGYSKKIQQLPEGVKNA